LQGGEGKLDEQEEEEELLASFSGVVYMMGAAGS
jgi:hypothetical protein